MIVNSDKFQAMLLQKGNKNEQSHKLQIDREVTETTDSEKLLAVTIDKRLNSEEHISTQTSVQLNALNRMKVYIGKKEMKTLINSFVYSNFNYCLLV